MPERTASESIAALDHQAYPNRAVEDEIRHQVEHNVDVDVREHEALLIAQARELANDIGQTAGRISATEASLREIAQVIGARADDDLEDLLERWWALDNQAHALMNKSFGYPERVAAIAACLADPLAALSELQSKYPLRRNYGI